MTLRFCCMTPSHSPGFHTPLHITKVTTSSHVYEESRVKLQYTSEKAKKTVMYLSTVKDCLRLCGGRLQAIHLTVSPVFCTSLLPRLYCKTLKMTSEDTFKRDFSSHHHIQTWKTLLIFLPSYAVRENIAEVDSEIYHTPSLIFILSLLTTSKKKYKGKYAWFFCMKINKNYHNGYCHSFAVASTMAIKSSWYHRYYYILSWTFFFLKKISKLILPFTFSLHFLHKKRLHLLAHSLMFCLLWTFSNRMQTRRASQKKKSV